MMNMMINNAVSSTKGLAATASKGSASSGAEAFSQLLGQSINTGGAASAVDQATPAMSQFASLLIAGATADNASETDQEATASQLIVQLLAELAQSDDKIADDRNLLEQLQAWLAQTNQLLASLHQTDHLSADAKALSASQVDLSANAETIRFDVQDKLLQLAALVQPSTGNMQETANAASGSLASGSLMKLSSDFQQMLQSDMPQVMDQASGQSGQTAAMPQITQLLQSLQQFMKQANQRAGTEGNAEPSNQDAGHQELLVQQAAKPERTLIQQQLSKQANDPSDDTETPAEHASSIQKEAANEIFTAGQLALKGHEAPVVKATQPPVMAANQFATEMSNFIKHLDISRMNGLSEAKIILFPEQLGQVDVRISIQNGHIVAQFMTEQTMAKDMLDQQMVQLRAALQSQGLQVDKLEVTQSQEVQSQMYHDQRQPNSSKQQGEQKNKNRVEENVELNGQHGTSGIEELERSRMHRYGSGNAFTATV